MAVRNRTNSRGPKTAYAAAQYLYAINTGSGTISSSSIAAGATLTLIGSTTVANTGGVGATDPGISADGRTLYINESRVDAVGEFAVNGGTLTALTSSPIALPAGATPAGIAVTSPSFGFFGDD